jgi:hypothetical protein
MLVPVGPPVYLPSLVRRDVTAAKTNRCSRSLCGPCRIKGKYAISSSHNFSLYIQHAKALSF